MTLKRSLAVDHSCLRKRSHMAEIFHYLDNGQEHVKFPNRQATCFRNHLFISQLDFFDMKEEQHKAWEEQVWDQEAQEISKQTEQFKAMVFSSRQRDAGAQWRGVTNDEWENSFRSTHWVYDADSDTMQTVDPNKK